MEANISVNVTVHDPQEKVKIEKFNIPFSDKVNINGIDDPFYTLKTNGSIIRPIIKSPYPYRAKKVVSGGLNSSGNCSGEITFNKTSCEDKILVAENTSGVTFSCFSGFIIEDSVNLSSVSSCFVTGNSTAVEDILAAVNESGYDEIYIDEKTKSAWLLPIKDEIDKGYYISGNGPDFLLRLEGKTNTSEKGLLTFVNLPELSDYGLPVDTESICVDYIYFGDKHYIGYPIRGLPNWFKLNRTFTDEFGLTELCEGC